METHILKTIEKELSRYGKLNRRTFLKLAAINGLTITSVREAKAASNAKGKIVIIGGGAAGISMAVNLKKRLNNPDITLIDPSDRQFYQPGFTLIASGVYQPDDVWKKQEDCIPDDIKWVKDSVAAVDPIWNQVTTVNNGKIPYDFLVLTPGLVLNWDKIEGFSYDRLGQGSANCIYDFMGAQ